MAIAFRVSNADQVAEALAANDCFSLILAGHYGKRELSEDHDFYTQPYAFLRTPKKGGGYLVFTCAVPWIDEKAFKQTEEAFEQTRLELTRDHDWLPVLTYEDSMECFEYEFGIAEADSLTFTNGGYYPGSFTCTKQSKGDLEAAAVRITCAACRWEVKSWRKHKDAVVESFRSAMVQTSSVEFGHGRNKRPRTEGDALALDILAKVVSVDDGSGQGPEGFFYAHDEQRVGSPPPYQRNPTYQNPNTPCRNNIQSFRTAGENRLIRDASNDTHTNAEDQYDDGWNDGFNDYNHDEEMDCSYEEYDAHNYFHTPRRSERPPIVRHTPPTTVRPGPMLPPSIPPGLDGERTVPALPRLPHYDAQDAADEWDGDLPNNRQPVAATFVEDSPGGPLYNI